MPAHNQLAPVEIPNRSTVRRGDYTKWSRLTMIQAGLERDVQNPIIFHSPYNDCNETYAEEQWDAIDMDPGMLALPDAFVAEKGLPVAQRFPWDESKGIYYLNIYHNMHCLVSDHWKQIFGCSKLMRHDFRKRSTIL